MHILLEVLFPFLTKHKKDLLTGQEISIASLSVTIIAHERHTRFGGIVRNNFVESRKRCLTYKQHLVDLTAFEKSCLRGESRRERQQ
jgi:hypothetical protein